jgi:hypothetical protein
VVSSYHSYTEQQNQSLQKFSNNDRADVGKEMGTRIGKQCRERYHNHLKVGIKKGYWSAEEDALSKCSLNMVDYGLISQVSYRGEQATR